MKCERFNKKFYYRRCSFYEIWTHATKVCQLFYKIFLLFTEWQKPYSNRILDVKNDTGNRWFNNWWLKIKRTLSYPKKNEKIMHTNHMFPEIRTQICLQVPSQSRPHLSIKPLFLFTIAPLITHLKLTLKTTKLTNPMFWFSIDRNNKILIKIKSLYLKLQFGLI